VTDVDVGRWAEPWAVVIARDGQSAYVTLREGQRVVRIAGLRGAPALDGWQVRTGVEPTGIALSPGGTRLFAANFGDGTVSVIDPGSMAVVGTVDLGPAAGGAGRAHPRAVAVTDDGDGDDADETVYVTELFSQAGDPSAGNLDADRRALVYRFEARDLTLRAPVALETVAGAGCAPNQLAAAAIEGGRLHVSALCQSRGSAEEREMTLVVDVKTNRELVARRVLRAAGVPSRKAASPGTDQAAASPHAAIYTRPTLLGASR
jgi:YVTN family beta-propeller protein